MGALFGKSKKSASRVTEQDKAVLQLKQQRDKIKQYQKRIEINLEKDRLLARKLLQDGKRDRAKLLLKKKLYQEKLLSNTDSQLENLEKLTHDIEFAQIEIQTPRTTLCKLSYKKCFYLVIFLSTNEPEEEEEAFFGGDRTQNVVLDGLKVGNAALKKVHAVLDISEIEQILEESKEGIEKQREIDEMLSGALTEEDEMAVQSELDEIIRSTQKLPDVPEEMPEEEELEPELPDVPVDAPKKVKEKVHKIALEA